MKESLNIIIPLIKVTDGLITVDVFNETTHTYEALSPKQYIPYIKKAIQNGKTFTYTNHHSFSLHLYTYSESYQVCIIGRFNDKTNIALFDLFSALKEARVIEEHITIFNKIFDAIPEYVAYKTVDGVFQFVTNDINQLYKDRFDSIIGENVKDVYSPQSIQDIEKLDQEVYQKHAAVKRTIEVETDFGTKTFDSTRVPVYDQFDNPQGVISINRDVTNEKAMKETLNITYDIQSKIIDIASSFISVLHNDYDTIINQALKQIGSVIQADRVYIFKYEFEQNIMVNTYEWCNVGVVPEIDQLQNVPITDYLEDWVLNHTQHKNIIISDVESLDHESALYDILSKQDIKSLFTMPIFIDESCYGFIGFDSVIQQRSWEDYPNILDILPNLFGNLFSRNQMLHEIKDAKELASNTQQFYTNLLKYTHQELKSKLNSLSMVLDNESNYKNKKFPHDIQQKVSDIAHTIDHTVGSFEINIQSGAFEKHPLNLEQLCVSVIREQQAKLSKMINLDFDYDIQYIFQSDTQKLHQMMTHLLQHIGLFSDSQSISLKTSIIEIKEPYIEVQFTLESERPRIQFDAPQDILDAFYSEDNHRDHLPFVIAKKLLEKFQGHLDILSTPYHIAYSYNLTLYIKEPIHLDPINEHVLCLFTTSNVDLSLHKLFTTVFTHVDCMTFEDDLSTVDSNKYNQIFIYVNDPSVFSNHISRFSSSLSSNVPVTLIYSEDNWIYHSNNAITFYNTIAYPFTSQYLYNTYSLKNTSGPKEKPSSGDVLVIDDNKASRKTITRELTKIGYTVLSLASGIEASKITQLQDIHVVLIDYHMPDLNGLETYHLLQKVFPDNIQYILMTASTEIDYTSLSDYFDHIIHKPIDFSSLQRLLNTQNTEKEINKKVSTRIFNQAKFNNAYSSQHMKQTMLEQFLNDYDNYLDQLALLIQSPTHKGVEKLLSRIKRSAKPLFTQRLVDCIKALKNEIKTEQKKISKTSLTELKYTLNESYNVLNTYYKSI
ncbi:MAG: response regulator [Candidatus Izemoplasma sp.]|nr:response regulator [Candidatus Izemoplasma sp.]